MIRTAGGMVGCALLGAAGLEPVDDFTAGSAAEGDVVAPNGGTGLVPAVAVCDEAFTENTRFTAATHANPIPLRSRT